MRRTRSRKVSLDSVCACRRSAHKRERERGQPRRMGHAQAARGEPVEHGGETAVFELLLQHFVARLAQQQVVGVVPREYVVDQPARGLQLPQARAAAARQPGLHQPGDARDVAELSSSELRDVQRCPQVAAAGLRPTTARATCDSSAGNERSASSSMP